MGAGARGDDGEHWWQDWWSQCRLRWQRWEVTPMDRAISLSLLLSSFSVHGEMCSCDMWVCSKQTCQNDHWSENEPHCQRASALWITQTGTNTANKHTHRHTCINTHAKAVNHYYAYPLTEMWYTQLIPLSEGAGSKDTEAHRHSWTPMHVHASAVFAWGCVSACVSVRRCYWIIHLWLVRAATSKLSMRSERVEGEREGGGVGVGGLEEETKTKIQDEQWWEGQSRSDGWLSDSSQCLPLMLNTVCVCLTVCLPVHSLWSFGINTYWASSTVL